MSKETSEIVDTTQPEKQKVYGVDVGTMNLVVASQTDKGEIEISNIRNMYLPVDKNQIDMVQLSEIDYVESDDSIYIIGDDAYKFANMFGQQVKRPMSKGLISPTEIDGIDVLALIIKQLMGKSYNGHIVYSVPAASVDMDNNILYHEGVFKRIFTELGYTSESFNEAMAIVYSQCKDNKFSALAFSFGAGMTNCLHGDTRIKLLDGTNPTIRELSENRSNDTFWVYSRNSDGEIVPGLAHSPRITKKVKHMVVLTLDNGEQIKSTVEHPFMRVDGTYCRADELIIGDSLSPLYTRTDQEGLNGYEMMYQEGYGWKYTHRMVPKYFAESSIPRPNVIHHYDFNKLNNDPNNLIIMSRDEHIALHGRCAQYCIEHILGKTYEEIYGVEKAQKMKIAHSVAMKRLYSDNPELFINSINALKMLGQLRTGLNFNEIFGNDQAEIIRTKMSEARLGKTYEEFYNLETAKRMIESRRSWCTKQCEENTFGYNSLTDEQKKLVAVTQFKKGQHPWNYNISKEEYAGHINFENLTTKAKEQWTNNELKNKMMFGKGISIAKEAYTKYQKIDEESYESIRSTKIKTNWAPISYSKWIKYYSGISLVDDVINWNHTITHIEIIDEECDVYDITVEDHHNFALTAGVFVHNCAFSWRGVPIVSFSVARAGDWIDEQSAMSLGTIANRITAIKEKNTDLANFKVGNKKERRIREAIVYYYRELIHYCLEKVKDRLNEAAGNLELSETVPVIVSGGTSLAKGFLPLFKEVLNENSDFPIGISEVKHANDPLSAVAEGLLIRALTLKKNTEIPK